MNPKYFRLFFALILSLFFTTSYLRGANVVTTTTDTGVGSLRTIVAAAPANSTVTFATGLSGQTIMLGSEVPLNGSVIIDASGLANGIILNGGNNNRAFNLGGSANIQLIGLTITNCTTPDAGGALYSSPGSALHISRCTFTGNSGLEGGAILVDGTLAMDDSTLFGNSGGYGGALQCRNTTTLTHCTISGNDAPSGGGGVYNKNTTLTINNCVIAGNTSSFGGADIYSQIAALAYVNANLIQVIVHDNPTASDTGPAPLTSAPVLFPLGNYGGPTPTMPPNFGSPAIDAGGSTSLTVDQRGLTRTVGSHPDLGAVEVQATEPFFSMVQSFADSGPWTLRAAIASVPSGSNITFAGSLSGKTISLTSAELLVNSSITITGLGATNLAISGNNARRVFNIPTGMTVNISGLTIRNGEAGNGANGSSAGVPGGNGLSGGGITNNGTLNLTNCALVSNSSGNGGAGFPGVNPTSGTPGTPGGAAGNGGAIYNQGTLRLSGCTISGNVAGSGGFGGFGSFTTFVGGLGGQGGSGAGIYNASGASATIFNCTFSGNAAGAGGDGGYAGFGQNNNPGGVDGNGGNGGSGGAIYSAGSFSLTSCTISGNSAGAEGGPGQFGSGSPIPGTNGVGGGVANTNASVQGCDNSIIALNSATNAPDVFGKFNSSGHNLIGKTDGSTGFTAKSDIAGTIAAPVNPLLGSLQITSGQTATLALLTGSPAIETGDDSLVGTDQRGFARPSGLHVDIGAYELDISSFPSLSVTPLGQTFGTASTVTGDLPVTFNVAVNPGGFFTVAIVQYGLTTNYGGSSNLTFTSFGIVATNLSNTVSVFAPGIVYHYRIVATNIEASVASPDQVFQTPAKYLLGDANGDGVVDQNEFNLVLSHYLAASPYLLITNALGLGQSNVTFALSNSTAGNYNVQYSTDMVSWQTLGPATPRYYFSDTNAPSAPQRYYRLTYPAQ